MAASKHKPSAKESKPSGATAAKAKAKAPRGSGSGGRNGSRSLLQSPTLRGAALAIFVALLALAVNRFWLAPQKSTTTRVASDLYIPRDIPVDHKRFDVTCHMRKKSKDFIPGCHKVGKHCGRALRDHFVTAADVVALREIAEIGMANRSRLGGPTIMDANTGFVKDGDGLVNIYQSTKSAPPTPRFTMEQFALYRDTIERIRVALMDEFQLKHLYFTAPTFITRIVGNDTWAPADLHDEYWHPHVDKDNTHHYDYSGLLYLSDYGIEFTGGLFAFIDKKREQIVEPARGRLMMFTSGKENLHAVRKVATGTRYVMSMWFTCDQRRQFKNFLDGKMHVHFKREDH